MFSLIVEFGVPQKNIFILGKAYSTNDKLLSELKEAGFYVHQPSFVAGKSFDDQHRENCNWLFNAYKKNISVGSRIIVLDDGGMLLSVLNENFEQLDKSIEVLGVEQTSSGFRKLKSENLKFPIINIARSVIKLEKESPLVAETCVKTIFEYILKKDIKPKQFLVIGLGSIGRALVELLRKRGEKVIGFDIVVNRATLREEINISRPNIIIGATGAASVSENDIRYICSLGYPVYLVSVSSSDREFPVVVYRTDNNSQIHSDVVYGNVTFVNNGFPINFKINRPEEGTKWIEKTICLILGSVLHLANIKESRALPKGFIDVPKKISDIL